MTSSKRDRQLAREKYERQQQRRAERASKARRNQRIVAVVLVVALVGGGVAWAVASARSTSPATPAALASALASQMPSATPSTAPSGAGSTAEPIGEEDCTPAGPIRSDDISFTEPGALSDPSLASTPAWFSLQTNCGDIVIRTDPKAPKTVASMGFLAEQGFFDGTACHRLTTQGIFVLQCGDPAGNGTGGPGYAVPDENLPTAAGVNYPAGTVAMANAGPGTAGSQLFIVYKDTTLPPNYTVWGQVESGLDIVARIANAGVEGGGADGRPKQPVVVDRATISAIPS